MNWNSWPFNTEGDIIVPTADDQTLLTAAHAVGKTFIMGVSPLQFKHIDAGDNWYRRGEQNLEYRFGQVLSMQPDFIELQTWNDAGESHYMGNSWIEAIVGTPIVNYSQPYDHTGYWQILPAFINAYHTGATTTDTMYPTNGADAQGTFWHHTLLAAGVSGVSTYLHVCPEANLVIDLPIGPTRTATRSEHSGRQGHGMYPQFFLPPLY
jgi:glucan endo-1,3-alpha-glucosidase